MREEKKKEREIEKENTGFVLFFPSAKKRQQTKKKERGREEREIEFVPEREGEKKTTAKK